MDPLFQEWLCDRSHLNRLEMKSHLKRDQTGCWPFICRFWLFDGSCADMSSTLVWDSPEAFLGQSVVAVSREPCKRCWPWFHLPVREVVGQFFLNSSKVSFANQGLQVELESCSMTLYPACWSHIGYMATHDHCLVCSSLVEHFCMPLANLFDN